MTPWQHYVIDGHRKGYDDGNNPPDELFFQEGYEVEYPDVAESGEDPWHHYVLIGKKEGRDNGLHPDEDLFFSEGYLDMYQDVATCGLEPWRHYVLTGKKEGRDNGNNPPEKLFFREGYETEYPDIAESGIDPWHHYVLIGKKEGRDNGNNPPEKLFFREGYETEYPDIAESGIDPWRHYVLTGKKEGRDNGNNPPETLFFRDGYETEYPDAAESGEDLWRHYVLTGKKEARDNGNNPLETLFFREGYKAEYPDVTESGIDPWHHYVLNGKKEGRDNGQHPKKEVFFSEGYLEMYPDVAASAIMPWRHYVLLGKKEGRDNGNHPPEKLFFRDGYETEYTDVAEFGEDPWHHYVLIGKKEGRDNGLHPNEKIFFSEGYLELYADVADSGADPWRHYVLTGKKEGRDNGNNPPETLFFRDGYETEYPDAAVSGEDPWHHYVLIGKKEGRDNGNHPNLSVFIPQVYSALYADVRDSGIDPWVHFAKCGRQEKRTTSSYPFFDENWYLENYPQVKKDPDVRSGVVTPEAHYFFKGWRLGYDPSLNFDTKHYLFKYRDVRQRQICPLIHYLAIGRFQNREPYNPHDLADPLTLTSLPEPFENGMEPKECGSVSLAEIEDNALFIMLAEHLGDILANEPVSRYIKWKHPDRPLYWVVERRFRDVVRYNPFLSGYIEVDSLKECIKLSRDLKGSQKIINLFFDGRTDRIDNPKYFWYARDNGIGFGNFYANDCLLSSMSLAAGLDRLMLAPRFWEDPEYSSMSANDIWEKSGISAAIGNGHLDNKKSKVILLHTKSNDQERDWTAEKFNELTEKILKKYPGAVIAELGMMPIVKANSERFITLEGVNNLHLIYQIIKRADLLIGIDSSFMHMANASGTRSVVIMGCLNNFSCHCPYSGRFWNGDGITFVRAGEGEESSAVNVSEVMKAVNGILSSDVQ